MANTQVWYDREGGILHRYTLTPAGNLTREVLAPGKRELLDENQRRRLSGVRPDFAGGWGRHALQIPEADLAILRSKYPELNCWDKDIRAKAWRKFLASPESRPYRVTERI